LKNRVTSSVRAAPSTARELAAAFGSLKKIGVTERYVYLEILRVALLRNPRYWGVWTVWAPNALDGADHRYLNEEGHDHTGRFVPLWRRDKMGQNIKLEPNIGGGGSDLSAGGGCGLDSSRYAGGEFAFCGAFGAAEKER
jgi:hypothetical protein